MFNGNLTHHMIFSATYETNPRYLFKLETEGYVIIALMQKHQWKNDPTGAKLRQIGFDIYSVSFFFSFIYIRYESVKT